MCVFVSDLREELPLSDEEFCSRQGAKTLIRNDEEETAEPENNKQTE